MPILNSLNELHDEITDWRRELHQNPELQYDVFETVKFVEDQLRSFGVDEITTGIGKTGLVALIKGNGGTENTKSGKTIGLRADMDALPIEEISGKPWASKTKGKMHACGHDGHTSMLLGAAKHLAATRNFNGTIALIFQPAEEGGAGAKAMIDDGMLDQFGIDEVFAMHNMPGIPVGEFAICRGAIWASTDEFEITLTGRGGHAAYPHTATDTIVAGANIVTALQTIASRNTNPLESLVISVTKFHAGTAMNVLPEQAILSGTIRTLKNELRDLAETRLKSIANNIAASYEMSAEIHYKRNYPVTVNHDAQTDFAADVAAEIVGENKVDRTANANMGAEDFSYMLEQRPGTYIMMGNGDTPALHNAAYDFNDEAIPYGVSYWVKLAERALA